MRLTVDGNIIERATVGDIRRAIRVIPPHDHWWILLAGDRGNWIKARPETDGTYALTYCEGAAVYESRRTIDGHALAETLMLYFVGDERWRTNLEWARSEPPQLATSAEKPSRWSPGQLIAVPLALVVTLSLFPWLLDWSAGLPWHRLPLPSWIDVTGAKLVLGAFATCVAVALIALVAKTIEHRRAARWPSVTGRITSSAPGFALTRSDDREMPRNERIADIVYRFDVGGTTYQGKRLSFAEKTVESEAADLLALYPVGKPVTVFYDPLDPSNAVLDRDLPKGVLVGCLTLIGASVLAVAGAVFLVNIGPDLIKSVFPNAVVPLVVMFGLGALVMALVAGVVLKDALAARSWPKVSGTVSLSEVNAFQMTPNRSSNSRGSYTRSTSYMPVIEYDYWVAGQAYKSRSVELDSEVAGSRALAERIVARYPVGRNVQVRYDPNNPTRAALEIKFGAGLFLFGVSLALTALAVWATGMLSDGPPLVLG